MIQKFLLFISLIFTSYVVRAQDTYLTRNGQISFFSTTPIEDIKATNNQVSSTINAKTGSMQFVVLIKGFQFKKAAMKEHFNQKEYMDSDKYPKSEFKGNIADINKVDFKKDGTYNVTVEGNLTLHGVTNKIKTTGTVTVKAGKVSSISKFNIRLADYKVAVPTIVSSKVAEIVEITVNCSYDFYQPKSSQ